MYDEDIVGFYSPFHCTHFSKNTLKLMLSSCGYKIIKCEEINHYNGYRIIAENSVCNRFKYQGNSHDRYSAIKQHIAALQSIIRIKDKINMINNLANNLQEVIIFGCGMHLELLYQKTELFYNRTINNTILVDSDPKKQGTSWRSFPIYSPEILRGKSWSKSYLIVSSYGSAKSIATAAMSFGVPEDKIIILYDTIASR